MIPGEYLLQDHPIDINAGAKTTTLVVSNVADRPIQVGSHFHFFEVNRGLQFDRKAAYGKRLHILAGTAVRFEPGEDKTVQLVELGGNRVVWGMNALVNGPLEPNQAALALAESEGFL